MSYAITVFEGSHKNTTRGTVAKFDQFSELAGLFAKCTQGGKHEEYFVRGALKPIQRKDANLESSSLLIIDGDYGKTPDDNAPLPEDVHTALCELGYTHFIYTSHSHSKEKNKFRAVIAAEEYSKEHLRYNMGILLEELKAKGIVIGYNKEMRTWSQPWFIPTRDDPEDGLFEYYAHESDVFSIDYDVPDVEEQSRNESVKGFMQGSSIKDMIASIIAGGSLHENLVVLSYQLIKEGCSEEYATQFLRGLMHCSPRKESDNESWQERYDDMPRVVREGSTKATAETEYEIEAKKERALDFPVLPEPPGLMGQLMNDAYGSMKIQHKELAIMCAVGIGAAICGRKFNHVHVYGSNHLGLNVYMSVVAGTGIGKSGIERYMKYVFSHLSGGNEQLSYLTSGSFSGQKALMDTLAVQRSCISVSTEAGIALMTKHGDQEGLMSAKLNLYGQSGKYDRSDGAAYSSKDNSIKSIKSPAYSQLSESTPDVLYKALADAEALKKGLLPRQSLFVIPDGKVKRNHVSVMKLSEGVAERLSELAGLCNQQSVDDIEVFEVTFKDEEMRADAERICERFDNLRSAESAEGIMAGRMYVKLLKHASLCSIINNGIDDMDEGRLTVDEQSWEWAKKFLIYEEKVNKIFLENMAGTDEVSAAIEIVAETIIKLVRGEHKSKKAQDKVGKALRDKKVIPVNVLRDVLAKNPSVRALGSGNGNQINTGLDKILKYLEEQNKIDIIKKNPLTQRQCQMVQVREGINY